MATRTNAREAVVGLLYAFAMGNERVFDFADEILNAKKIRNAQADFAKNLLNGVMAHLSQIDSIINVNLKSWELKRLGAIDKCILRLGVYEILKAEIDAPVAINEAIEIAKILGEENTGRFVNGVLDAVRKGEFDLEKGVEVALDSRESSADLGVDSDLSPKPANQKRFVKKSANLKSNQKSYKGANKKPFGARKATKSTNPKKRNDFSKSHKKATNRPTNKANQKSRANPKSANPQSKSKQKK